MYASERHAVVHHSPTGLAHAVRGDDVDPRLLRAVELRAVRRGAAEQHRVAAQGRADIGLAHGPVQLGRDERDVRGAVRQSHVAEAREVLVDDGRGMARHERAHVHHETRHVVRGQRTDPGARTAEAVVRRQRGRHDRRPGQHHGPGVAGGSGGGHHDCRIGLLDTHVRLQHLDPPGGFRRAVGQRRERPRRAFQHGLHRVGHLGRGDEAEGDHTAILSLRGVRRAAPTLTPWDEWCSRSR